MLCVLWARLSLLGRIHRWACGWFGSSNHDCDDNACCYNACCYNASCDNACCDNYASCDDTRSNHNPCVLVWVLQQCVLPNILGILLLQQRLGVGWRWSLGSTTSLDPATSVPSSTSTSTSQVPWWSRLPPLWSGVQGRTPTNASWRSWLPWRTETPQIIGWTRLAKNKGWFMIEPTLFVSIVRGCVMPHG